MTDSLQMRMTPYLQQIAGGLVEATPEWWKEATLRVEVSREANGNISLSHIISSQQHPHDVVTATEEICDATRALQQLCEQAGQAWLAITFRVAEGEEGWRFSSEFQYAD